MAGAKLEAETDKEADSATQAREEVCLVARAQQGMGNMAD